MTKNYTLQEIIPFLAKRGDLHYEIEHFGSSMDNPAHQEIATYQVTLQGSIIATHQDRFDYEHFGPPEPFPDPVEVISDLTNFSVYPYHQQTRDGFTEGANGFVVWVQETCGERILRVQDSQRNVSPPSLGTLLEEWNNQWVAVKRMEEAIGRDILKMIMEAER